MQKETISDRQAITLLILFIIGSFLLIIPGLEAKEDTWLAVFLGMLAVIPLLLIYGRILSLFPSKDIFDIFEVVLGRIIGKFISLLYIWFAFHLGALVIRNITEFINSVGLTYTPMYIYTAAISLLSAWGVKEGIECLGRFSEFFTPFIIVLLSIFIIFMIPNMDINNILPFFYNGLTPFVKGTFGLISFPFAETVVFTMVLCCLKNNKSPYKIYIKGILIAGILGTIFTLSLILVIGAEIASIQYFPGYMAARRINIRNFIQSFEIILALLFLITGFIKVSICLLASCKGISKVFGYKDYRVFVISVALTMANLSIFIYDNIKQMYHWAIAVWPYYAFPFQFILPVIILISAEIKVRAK